MPSIVITGAGSGIGRITARRFLEAGWQVGLIGRRQDALEETAGDHGQARVLPCDVTDANQVEQRFSEAAHQWGRIDALFNNAGRNVPTGMIDEIALEDWKSILEVNVSGMFLAARAAFRQMRAQTPQGGRIINNGSISAHAPRYGSSPYTTTKHAVTGLTKALSLDGRAFDIACGQIDIGNALTDMAERMARGVPQADGHIAVEPLMDASHVAEQVLAMASLPLNVNTQFVTLMASAMPFVGRG
ncbi:SDR family oxidoreductase [Salinicola rhizosphaerae]|uniref:3-oxoacyl-ACP reductase n=1 Tax=Salinicola rhizosphaerae TaxID=1443141 RepID=A0ABQ3E2D0_9GAMM|nr:SDR family oxidoreductase [Salinicola rhizosphaerae]GHB22560.1 3-oxoacyl-ACP reductase [Salinicola rhizosphaerae]